MRNIMVLVFYQVDATSCDSTVRLIVQLDSFDYITLNRAIMRVRRRRNMKTSPFIAKLHEMLEDASNNHLITWGHRDSTFFVRHPLSFSLHILPKYFRHNNYSSFLRQLNLYNFNKLRSDESLQVFHHPLFQRGDFEKHRLIKRVDQQPQQQEQQEEGSATEGFAFAEGSRLQDKIGVIRHKQKRLRESCQKLINQNHEILSDNYIFKATLEDESSNDRLILDRITAFMMRHYQDGDLGYCDTDIIKGLLKFLNNAHSFHAQPPSAIRQFFKFIENNELKTAVRWVASMLGQKKKKNFTIVTKGSFTQGHQNDILSILD